MAILPLKQKITVTPCTGDSSDFGVPEMGAPTVMKCRYQETVTLVTSISSGKEVVSKATIFFDGFVDINERTRLEYINESGQTLTHTPLSIAVKRHINGKAILTVVYV
jgi:hypothetical protein